MANVIHRTTYERRDSVQTTDYPVETWVRNPDLSAVDGVPMKYWKLTGDVFSEMDQGEKDAVDAADLPALKEARYLEIDTRTTELIEMGFGYGGKVFSLSRQAQSNLLGVQASINKASRKGILTQFEAAVFPLTFNTLDDSTSIDIATVNEFDTFFDVAFGTGKAHLESGTSLKEAIRNAATKAGVDAVVDAR